MRGAQHRLLECMTSQVPLVSPDRLARREPPAAGAPVARCPEDRPPTPRAAPPPGRYDRRRPAPPSNRAHRRTARPPIQTLSARQRLRDRVPHATLARGDSPPLPASRHARCGGSRHPSTATLHPVAGFPASGVALRRRVVAAPPAHRPPSEFGSTPDRSAGELRAATIPLRARAPDRPRRQSPHRHCSAERVPLLPRLSARSTARDCAGSRRPRQSSSPEEARLARP